MNKFNITVWDTNNSNYKYYIETSDSLDQLANKVYEAMELERPIKVAYKYLDNDGFAVFNGKKIIDFEIEEYKDVI